MSCPVGMGRLRSAAGIGLAALLLCSMGCSPNGNIGPPSGISGRIAFISAVNDSDDVRVTVEGGTSVSALTNHEQWTLASYLTPSPDATKLAYLRLVYSDPPPHHWEARESHDLCVVDADGTDPQVLTAVPDTCSSTIAWSPEGDRVAFSGSQGIACVDLDGGQVVGLTSDAGDYGPVWSPDGSHIAFLNWTAETSATGQGRSGTTARQMDAATYQVCVMNEDGTGRVPISNAVNDRAMPDPMTDLAWSPDGSKLAYVECVIPGWTMNGPWIDHSDIHVASMDGMTDTNLTSDAGDDRYPAWSPDGTRLVFARNEQLYAMSASGSGASALTDSGAPSDVTSPVFSSDGQSIAFLASSGDDGTDIFVASADGSELYRLTTDEAPKHDLLWLP